IYVYSTHPDSAKYSLGFTALGQNKGHYVLRASTANGRVYDWVPPANGVPQGNFEPVILLITPKKQQLFSLTTDYEIGSFRKVNLELAASDYDPNTFSRIPNSMHWAATSKLNYTGQSFYGKKD